jgi:dipeptidyl aminopeptidase/acylaminoacyl peptidase
MGKKVISLISIFVGIILVLLLLAGKFVPAFLTNKSENGIKITASKIPLNPLSIIAMRQKSYPGSDITIEQTLPNMPNYKQYIASYMSDGLKIYGLLTVPMGASPKNGWPAIIFNHGYIPPEQYVTTERYVAYVDGFAHNGYVVFKPDYRGNGDSEGQPEGAYYSPAYTDDVLNALASIKRYSDVNPAKIGMWGHSMGGNITLRSLVVNTKDIKAAVIWGGVVGSYNDLMFNWHRAVPFVKSQRELTLRNRGRQSLMSEYGTPEQNPSFWNTIDPTAFIKDITAPVQLDAGGADEEVPVAFSQSLYEKLKATGKTTEFYTYQGADHNISGSSFNLAMQRSITFFDKYLKGN